MSKAVKYKDVAFYGVILLLISLIGIGFYYYRKTSQTLLATTFELENTKSELRGTLAELERINILLKEEQDKNALFGGEINKIVGTVGSLTKLAQTDKELLQKYSKVYFLNEHYLPDELATITPEYLFDENRSQYIHQKVWPYLEELLRVAEGRGNPLQIISAYRSFGDQQTLKGNYSVVYCTGANRFSADQGYSEHQLGTTVDFTTPDLGADFTSFEETDGYRWLLNNAYKYGFVLSYPEGNGYYQFEPWHWRFVGKSLAKRLHEDGVNFYDLNQASIDAYLISIFD